MMTKQQLGNILWGMADILYGKVEDYKSYILTLLFYKRISDNYSFEEESAMYAAEEDLGRKLNDKQAAKVKEQAHLFRIPEDAFWTNVSTAPTDLKNEKLNLAVNAIADANPKLKGIINAVKWNEAAPDGSGGKRLEPRILQDLINYLTPVDLSNKNVPLDVLGHAYEYLIKRFADENKGGTVAGQFYTPPEIVELMVRYLNPKKGNKVYDPTCGSGGFLIKAADHVIEMEGDAKGLRLFGQETVWTTWAIATMNIMLHGLEGEIQQGDTLINPRFRKSDSELDTFDIVLANFPFSVENWAGNGTQKKDKKGKSVLNNDGSPKYEYPAKESYVDPFNRLIYGTPNFTNGDFAFLQHIIASLEPDGMAGVVCPNGVLFKGQPEKTEEEDGQNRKADDDYLIRRGFIEGIGHDKKNIIDAIVALPENVFYGNTIPGAIIFFNKNKPKERKDKILMVWGAKKGWYKEEPDQNVLRPQDVMRLLIMLLSHGDIDVAKKIIPLQQKRLFALVQDNLDYRLLEIDEKYHEEAAQLEHFQNLLSELQTYVGLDNVTIEQVLDSQDVLILTFRKGKILIEHKDKRKTKIPTNDNGEFMLQPNKVFNLPIPLKLKAGNIISISKSDVDKVEKRVGKLHDIMAKKKQEVADAFAEADREKVAIQNVVQEMLTVFADPELSRRYFSVVDREEIIENEYNLNLPRYIDTIEPEKEIPVEVAVYDLKKAIEKEVIALEELDSLIKMLN